MVLTVHDVLTAIRKSKCTINRRCKAGVYGTGDGAIRRLAHRLGAPIETVKSFVRELIGQGRAKFTRGRLVATSTTKTTARGSRTRRQVIADDNGHSRPHRPQSPPHEEKSTRCAVEDGIPAYWEGFDPSHPGDFVITKQYVDPWESDWEAILGGFEKPSKDPLVSPECLLKGYPTQLDQLIST